MTGLRDLRGHDPARNLRVDAEVRVLNFLMSLGESTLDEQGHVVVLVDEEYGFKRHLWFTGMTAEALESYWAAIP